uniref:ATP-grasp domain-containing protein n=3 Tax=Emiliania huxleyi TaxID=2903 RepID=A0A6U8NLE2_EMIHU|mmetsp:Transcript_14076/g.41614  ORF Transcript_14076/g.41614 Transcript_14076/m.41614 type:complete len:531 (-) Transcript_14076:319-1911(-)
MRASTQQQRCVAIVDPISTGACVAVEATKRGYAVVAVWSAVVTKDLRNMVPEHAKGLRYHAQVDEGESIEATTQLLRKAAAPHKVDAVICGAETGVELADRLSQRSGLASNGTELGNRRDKHTQQQAVREAGMRAVRETLGTEWQTVAGWVASELEANGKVVLKPVESAGSDGVKLCASLEESKAHFETLMGAQRRVGAQGGAVLCQEFLVGPEYVVDTVTSAGEHKVTAVWKYDKRPCNGAAFVYFGMLPVPPSEAVAQRLIGYVLPVLDALQIRYGATHGEVILTKDGPCLVEMNCRPHGGDGNWLPMARALTGGYSQVDALLDAFVEPQRFAALPPCPGTWQAAAQEFLVVSTQEGKVASAPGYELARSLRSFVSLEAFVSVGDQLARTVDVFTQAASIVLVHADAAVVTEDAAALRRLEQSGDFFTLAVEYPYQTRESLLASAVGTPTATRVPLPASASATGSVHSLSSGGHSASFVIDTTPSSPTLRRPERRPPRVARPALRPSGLSVPFVGTAGRLARMARVGA